mmetsp:Transcript_4301/g.8500  ORF Transcript_4301/g.8500 Transcript_4301/m.8500 type:complete len:366 (-) Transcript_4301:220-1317(-)|eukprot:CAMPEP_0167803080 /NCGR_PEP_ID=MMETSP0111_2-20121227/19558_1 /TAXON_ID=91324 /ORGANISM="Lotharella globosa, Strain CCCM811" /LENGTH=365 /DNA_ID=CAMNT_0007699351 /DNA_START=113 /DNA_END=1210 /DNA_ORIENTATION=-
MESKAEKEVDGGGDWWSFASSAIATVSTTVQKHAAVAVEQGSAAIQSAKQDLEEFATTLSSETVELKEEVQDQLDKVAEKMKKTTDKGEEGKEGNSGLDALSENIEKVGEFFAGLLPAAKVPASPVAPTPGQSQKLTPAETKLFAMQCDKNSYITDPGEDDYPDYFKNFGHRHETELKADVLQTLNSNEIVRKFYTSLVPDTVKDDVFWARYFFRVEILRKEEQRRKILLARLNKTKDKPKPKPTEKDKEKNKEKKEAKGEASSVPAPRDKQQESGAEDTSENNNTQVDNAESDANAAVDEKTPDTASGSENGWVGVEKKSEEAPKPTGEDDDVEEDLDLNAVVEGMSAPDDEEKKEDDDCWVWE